MDQDEQIYIKAGVKMRDLRQRAKLSLEEVAKEMGFSYQQLQKYEKGANCISIGKLYKLAVFFKISPSAFFPGTEFEYVERLCKLENRLSEIKNITDLL